MPPRMRGVAARIASFGTLLRSHGFPSTPDQTITFLRSVTLLGPSSIRDVYQAAVASFGPVPERREEFDALFRSHFYGASVPLAAEAEQEEIADTNVSAPETTEDKNSGEAAREAEMLQDRSFLGRTVDEHLRRFAALLPDRLPRRKAFRQRLSPHGHAIHMRRSLRQLLRNDGDIPHPDMAIRSVKPRNILILIDVSGSMKTMTEDYLRLSHIVAQHVANVEVFTFATRLSRITPALKIRNSAAALATASARVDDWDGGTRIGACLAGFLAVPRYSCFARGAVVLVISDGMERGDTSGFVKAVWRLSRLAWRLSWATPLAADPRFQPRTRAMREILPALDDLTDASSVAHLSQFVLGLAKPAKKALEVWGHRTGSRSAG
jgi:uncharacterized protein with von Willebrand factor type A (vWA) domain